jgi:hypothetical protein
MSIFEESLKLVMHDLRLTEIWIYPIKSLGGIRLKSSRVLGKGLEHDRRWMLIDAEDNFMTQRSVPAMALFGQQISGDALTVSFKNQQIAIPLHQPSGGKAIQTRVFDDAVSVVEMNPLYSEWFSNALGVTCRLVYFSEDSPRPVHEPYQKNGEHVSLADGFPFLIIGEESLNDLNRRLEVPVPMNRFRPNFVFRGGSAFEEDTWQNFAIGRNRFAGVKPCGRCMITTVNQVTAVKGVEPLATLSSYRKRGGSVYFGQNVIAIDHDEIFEGDSITLE